MYRSKQGLPLGLSRTRLAASCSMSAQMTAAHDIALAAKAPAALYTDLIGQLMHGCHDHAPLRAAADEQQP